MEQEESLSSTDDEVVPYLSVFQSEVSSSHFTSSVPVDHAAVEVPLVNTDRSTTTDQSFIDVEKMVSPLVALWLTIQPMRELVNSSLPLSSSPNSECRNELPLPASSIFRFVEAKGENEDGEKRKSKRIFGLGEKRKKREDILSKTAENFVKTFLPVGSTVRSVGGVDTTMNKREGDEEEKETEHRRVYHPQKQLMAFHRTPLFAVPCLTRLVQSKYWMPVCITLCVILEIAILIPSSSLGNKFNATLIYCLGVTGSGTLFWIHLTQTHSRAHFWYCICTFDFLYQFFNFAALIAADTYTMCQILGNYWTMVPHIFQTLATCLTCLTIDAYCGGSKVFKSILVAYYGLIIFAFVFYWRFLLGKQNPGIIDFKITTVQISAVAEQTAMTCGIFMLRFAFLTIWQKKDTILTKFRLQEQHEENLQEKLDGQILLHAIFNEDPSIHSTPTASESTHLLSSEPTKTKKGEDTSRMAAAATVNPLTQDAAARDAREEALEKIVNALSSADSPFHVQSIKTIRKDMVTERRCFRPRYRYLIVSGKKFIHSQFLLEKTGTRIWYCIVFLATVALCFCVFPISYEHPGWFLLQKLVEAFAFVIYFIYLTQVSRGVVWRVGQTFDFWFLIYKAVVIATCNGYRTYRQLTQDKTSNSTGGIEVKEFFFVFLSVLLWLTFILLLLFCDGTSLSKKLKGSLFLIFALVLAGEIVGWRFHSQKDISIQIVSLLKFNSTVGALAQGASLTMLTYCLRYAFNALCKNSDMVVNFDAVEIPDQFATELIVNSPFVEKGSFVERTA